MELAFLMTLIALLGGIWLFLYQTILERTATSFDYSTQLFLGVMHFAVLCYLVMTLYAFFLRGMTETTEERQRRLAIISALILETWPVTLAFLALEFFATRMSSSDTALKVTMCIFGGAALAIQLYRQANHQRQGRQTPLKMKHTLYLYGTIASLGMVSIAVMSETLADVRITTDKEFYGATDPVIFSVRTGGYLFRPTVKKISLGGFERTTGVAGTDDITSLVPAEIRYGSNMIEVDFEPQITGRTIKAYKELKIVTQQSLAIR